MEKCAKLIGPAIALATLLALSACDGIAIRLGTGDLRLSVASVSAKSILPAGAAIASYSARGAGPAGAAIPATSSASGSFSFDGLAAGSWTISVDGLDAGGGIVASGSTTVEILAGRASSASIRLAPIAGAGTLALTVTWPSDRSVESVEGTIAPSGGSSSTATFAVSGASATYSVGLAAGSYTVIVYVRSHGLLVAAPLQDTALVYAGKTSTGSFGLTESNFDLSFVAYDANGATSGSPPVDSGGYGEGDAVAVLGNTGGLARTGYAFDGWSLSSAGTLDYAAGSTFAMGSSSVTLYAHWVRLGSGTVTVIDPPVVSISLSGQAATLPAGGSMTIVATPSESVDSYAWYLDGAAVAGQTSSSFAVGTSLAKGAHSVMVVVGKNGCLFSSTFYFKVI